MADGSQRIAGSGESAIQTNSHAILEQSRTTSETSDMYQECIDLLPPSDPRKLYSAIVRKAAGWAVMDTNTRLSNNSASMPKGAKGESKSAYSASVPCKLFYQGSQFKRRQVQIFAQTIWSKVGWQSAAKARTLETRKIDARRARKSRTHHTEPGRARKQSRRKSHCRLVHRQRRPKRDHQVFRCLRQPCLRRSAQDDVENASVHSSRTAQQTSDHDRRSWTGGTHGMSGSPTSHDQGDHAAGTVAA